MGMVLLQDPDSCVVRPAHYPMSSGHAPIIFDAISHRVVSGLAFLIVEDTPSRYKYPIQIHSPLRDTTGCRVAFADIGLVMSKCRPMERQQAPEYVRRIQSMMSIAGSPVVLHRGWNVCGQGCEEHPNATCSACMLAAHQYCITERVCGVKLNFEVELLLGDIFRQCNVFCLCSACFSSV